MKYYLNTLNFILLIIYLIFYNIIAQIINAQVSQLTGFLLALPIFLLFFSCIISNKFKYKVDLLSIYIATFSLYCLSSSLWSVDTNLSITKGLDLFKTSIVMLIISIAFQNEISIEKILKCIMISSYIIIGYEIYYYGIDYFLYIFNNSLRFTSEYINANQLGMYIAYGIIINIYLLINKKINILTIILIFLGLLVVGATGSRKAFLQVLLGIFLVIFLHSYNRRNLIVLFTIIPILFLFIYQSPFFAETIRRIHGIFGLFQIGNEIDKSAEIRLFLINLGWQLFTDHPLLGIGIDCSRLYTYGLVIDSAKFQYNLRDSFYLHNNYFEILACGGIIGFIFYYWFYIFLIFRYWKYRDFNNCEYNICITLLILHVISDFGVVSYYSKITYIYLFVIYFYSKILVKRKIRLRTYQKIVEKQFDMQKMLAYH